MFLFHSSYNSYFSLFANEPFGSFLCLFSMIRTVNKIGRHDSFNTTIVASHGTKLLVDWLFKLMWQMSILFSLYLRQNENIGVFLGSFAFIAIPIQFAFALPIVFSSNSPFVSQRRPFKPAILFWILYLLRYFNSKLFSFD